MQNVEIIYSKETGTLAVALRQPTVEESRNSRRHDLGRGIKAWMSEDGEVLYSLEVDGGAGERADLDKILVTTIEGHEKIHEQTVRFGGRPE